MLSNTLSTKSYYKKEAWTIKAKYLWTQSVACVCWEIKIWKDSSLWYCLIVQGFHLHFGSWVILSHDGTPIVRENTFGNGQTFHIYSLHCINKIFVFQKISSEDSFWGNVERKPLNQEQLTLVRSLLGSVCGCLTCVNCGETLAGGWGWWVGGIHYTTQ